MVSNYLETVVFPTSFISITGQTELITVQKGNVDCGAHSMHRPLLAFDCLSLIEISLGSSKRRH